MPAAANGQAPPSTITAQLVNDLTTGTQNGQLQQREMFEQLLAEMLHAGEDQESDSTVFDFDIQTCQNLISVVVEGGLQIGGPGKDPFAPTEQALSDTVRSLKLIGLAVQKHPDVLYTDAKQHSVPLFVWLLPRLLSLLSTWDEEEVHGETLVVLSNMLNAKSRSPQSLQRSLKLLHSLQRCVNGAFNTSKCRAPANIMQNFW